jgi:transposase
MRVRRGAVTLRTGEVLALGDTLKGSQRRGGYQRPPLPFLAR